MTVTNARIRPYGKAAIEEAAALIRAGQPVAVPTETVYGLAADATNGEAVARIYEAKGRPSFNPLIVHVPDLAAAERIGVFDETARKLAETYWPGPLTLVLPHRESSGIASLVTAGLPTIALRVPRHRAMQALLAATDKPLAAPSANASGSISPTRAEHVAKSLGTRAPLIIDDGPTEVGIESTIVAVDSAGTRLLRPGAITADAIWALTGVPLLPAMGSVEAPGQLASHYAPSKPLRLNARDRREGEWLIGFGEVKGDANLSERGDLVEAAARLFDRLHQADARPEPAIAVAPIPETGIGAAIADRLRRAAF